MRQWFTRPAAGALGLVLGAACGGQPTKSKPAPPPRAAEPAQAAALPAELRFVEDLLAPYPPGPWRMVRSRLDHVALHLAHVFIADDRPQPKSSALRPEGWRAERPTTRSRAQARELAAMVARKARRKPADFGLLAEHYSDDLATRAQGGELGTWTASLMFEAFLDALSTMQPGDTSRVVESPMGFHVLKLLPPAPEQRVAADEIVISYRDTMDFPLRPGRNISRSREQARAIAERVFRRASKADAQGFAALVQAHSDHRSAERGGDIGVWSTHRTSNWHREIHTVAGLEVGRVARPIDSPMGFRIFRRTAATPRPIYAVQNIFVLAPEDSRDDPTATDVGPIMRGLHETLQQDPSRFASLQQQYCCAGVERWERGRGIPRVERIVEALPMGGISGPIRYRDEVRIVRRVDPASADDPPEVATVLPQVERPDVEHIVRTAGRVAGLVNYVDRIEAAIDAHGAQLDGATRARVEKLFGQLRAGLGDPDPNKRLAALAGFRAAMRTALGPETFDRLRQRVDQQLIGDLAPDMAALQSGSH